MCRTGERAMKTRTIVKCCDPEWDETFVFSDVSADKVRVANSNIFSFEESTCASRNSAENVPVFFCQRRVHDSKHKLLNNLNCLILYKSFIHQKLVAHTHKRNTKNKLK